MAIDKLAIRFRDSRYVIEVRRGSSDLPLIRGILCEDSEYRIPVKVEPRVIFDVGANIGITTLYFAALFPKARIYCFEPFPENVELLRRNTRQLGDRVRVVPEALGAAAGELDYCASDDPSNLGGGTFAGVGCDPSKIMKLPMSTTEAFCRREKISRIDIFKIDTEGSELAVLNGTPSELIRQSAVVIGELHGVDDYEVLKTLAESHHVGFHKKFRQRTFSFVAVNRHMD